MFLPLPYLLPEKSSDANAGLWFERFFNQFNHDAGDILKPEPNRTEQGNNFWLRTFKKAGNSNALQQAACRQMDLVKELNGKHKFFNTQWHFVTGTGYPHPVENGLSWHRTYGVPYLSGAAVKGLVRAWIEEWEFADIEDKTEQETKKRERLLSWFGSDDKDPKKQQHPSQAGDIIFFDALPVKEVKLTTDIMTPHCGKWYSEGGNITDVATDPEKVPADWHDPVPIPFLVVDKATSYLFSVAPRNAQTAERVDMNCVICCLTNALEWLGAGAKTATGYGGFMPHVGIHEVESQCLGLDEQINLMTKEKLIADFSENKAIAKTRTDYEEKGHDWKQVIDFIWKHHGTMIDSWMQSEYKKTKDAYKKLKAEKERL